jgi:hypothetical protein
MSGEPAFSEPPRTDGARDRRMAGLVVMLLVAFVGVAVAKPWGDSVQSAPSGGLPVEVTLRAAPSAAPSARVGTLPVAFTMPLIASSATWTGLRWRRLAPDDPLSLVSSVTRWSRGYVAVGRVAVPPSTPVWTSSDGVRWDPLTFGTPTTFWRGLAVLGVAERPTGLVAVTETLEYCGEPCPLRYVLPVVSWTSEDGLSWTEHLIPPEWLASPPGQPPFFALGPAGLVVATRGPAARLATSTDGVHWSLVPAGGSPAGFALDDLRGTATGYVAVGRRTTSDTLAVAEALWSADARHWSRTPTRLPRSSDAVSTVGSAATLVVGSKGVIAVGRDVTSPGATLWWQSSDGRHWAALPTFAPLGPTTCAGEGCGSQPNGALVGDSQRFVAVRGGPDGQAWVSSDGRSWAHVSMSGDLPGEAATSATLLPAGVLMTDGTTTWFGEALVP